MLKLHVRENCPGILLKSRFCGSGQGLVILTHPQVLLQLLRGSLGCRLLQPVPRLSLRWPLGLAAPPSASQWSAPGGLTWVRASRIPRELIMRRARWAAISNPIPFLHREKPRVRVFLETPRTLQVRGFGCRRCSWWFLLHLILKSPRHRGLTVFVKWS